MAVATEQTTLGKGHGVSWTSLGIKGSLICAAMWESV